MAAVGGWLGKGQWHHINGVWGGIHGGPDETSWEHLPTGLRHGTDECCVAGARMLGRRAAELSSGGYQGSRLVTLHKKLCDCALEPTVFAQLWDLDRRQACHCHSTFDVANSTQSWPHVSRNLTFSHQLRAEGLEAKEFVRARVTNTSGCQQHRGGCATRLD